MATVDITSLEPTVQEAIALFFRETNVLEATRSALVFRNERLEAGQKLTNNEIEARVEEEKCRIIESFLTDTSSDAIIAAVRAARGLVAAQVVPPASQLDDETAAEQEANRNPRSQSGPRSDSIDGHLEDIQGPAIFTVQDIQQRFVVAYDQVAVTSVQLTEQEFTEIHVLFEGELVDSFKRQPRIYNFQMNIPFTSNAVRRDDETGFVEGDYAGQGWRILGFLYNKFLRATQLTRNDHTMKILIKGYTMKVAPVALMRQYGAADPNVAQASLSCYVYGLTRFQTQGGAPDRPFNIRRS